MAIVTTLDHECAECASAVFDLVDSRAWLRAEYMDGAWVLTLRDDDAERAEIALEEGEMAHVLQTLGTLVEPAESPIVTILRSLPGQAEFLVRLCGGDPDADLEPLLVGVVTDSLRAATKRNLGIDL